MQATIRSILLTCVAVATFVVCAPTPATEQSEESAYESQSDWIMHLNVHELEYVLKYKTSTLDPMTAVDITYKIKDPHTDEFGETRRYEELWFHDQVATGAWRHEDLQIADRSHGTAFIDDTKDDEKHTAALSNTMVRILLDAHLKRAEVTFVVPNDVYENLSGDLAHLHFHQTNTLSVSQTGVLMHVKTIAAVGGLDNYFWFDKRK